MPDTQARIEALRWAAMAANYAVYDALHFEGIAAAESMRQRATILSAMADRLEHPETPNPDTAYVTVDVGNLRSRKAVSVDFARGYRFGFSKMVGHLAEEAAEEVRFALDCREAKQP